MFRNTHSTARYRTWVENEGADLFDLGYMGICIYYINITAKARQCVELRKVLSTQALGLGDYRDLLSAVACFQHTSMVHKI